MFEVSEMLKRYAELTKIHYILLKMKTEKLEYFYVETIVYLRNEGLLWSFCVEKKKRIEKLNTIFILFCKCLTT